MLIKLLETILGQYSWTLEKFYNVKKKLRVYYLIQTVQHKTPHCNSEEPLYFFLKEEEHLATVLVQLICPFPLSMILKSWEIWQPDFFSTAIKIWAIFHTIWAAQYVYSCIPACVWFWKVDKYCSSILQMKKWNRTSNF